MDPASRALTDNESRRLAITVHDRSFLVEAAAGSGKTAVLAGRIAMLLAGGAEPGSIAAVTFTELAASELLIRVREFVSSLSRGEIPVPLRVALPDGLSEDQRENLTATNQSLDEIVCSTIHGFCQRLISPYPVEADIDPGASVMDMDQADLAFREIEDTWLREELSGDSSGLLAELVFADPDKAVRLIHTVLGHFRRHREITHPAPENLSTQALSFREAAEGFKAFTSGAEFEEPETTDFASRFGDLAEKVGSIATGPTPANLVELLCAEPDSVLYTTGGQFRKYQKKGKWIEAAAVVGQSKNDGERLNGQAADHYSRCCEAWSALRQSAASQVLSELLQIVQPVMERFREHKRSTAQLDFDDLIFAARDLLCGYDKVRQALAERFQHVLVDEFQDTDPLQTEIFWRLCGEPAAGGDDWTSFRLRPGALFLVGDPKQAIYRFRGADITAYMQARQAFRSQAPNGVLSISTNFRSSAPLLTYVNERFESLFSEEKGQPGFQTLDPFRPERAGGQSVLALNVPNAGDDDKPKTNQLREWEAETVAATCAHLIESETIRDRESGEVRPCRPGDIALLAPTGTDLWRYEEALENRGIPVATQAGKGFFRRQEVQDLIAMTRVLSDSRDTLAFGALLRGPLVGLTEEELLDIVWALPRSENGQDGLPRFDLNVEPEAIVHPYAREIVERLRVLRRRVNSTTPHDLLSQAVDSLRVRPILLQRHGQAERALANVDLYLNLSRAYAVRGVRAFSEAMTAAWTDESRAVEGRPDAQEEAVALYTMHAAKGLEWPIVMPINAMTQLKSPDSDITDRVLGVLYCPVFGVNPSGHEEIREAEMAELNRERVRLWYVAATRARDLLVLPRSETAPGKSTWLSLVDMALSALPALTPDRYEGEIGEPVLDTENSQTREKFAAEAKRVSDLRTRIVWSVPSREEGAVDPVPLSETPAILDTDGDGAPTEGATIAIQGGRERGIILHKLIEEVLNGETKETRTDLITRAEMLIRILNQPVEDDPAVGLVPTELADCVIRALQLPEIAELRPRLLPEFPVYASVVTDGQEDAAYGIADAIAFNPDGTTEVVVDWKSDVDPDSGTLKHYRTQVRAYVDMTGAERGLIVCLTPGTVIKVEGAKTGDSG